MSEARREGELPGRLSSPLEPSYRKNRNSGGPCTRDDRHTVGVLGARPGRVCGAAAHMCGCVAAPRLGKHEANQSDYLSTYDEMQREDSVSCLGLSGAEARTMNNSY